HLVFPLPLGEGRGEGLLRPIPPFNPLAVGRGNLLHSFQCTVVHDCGSKSLLSRATSARISAYSSLVTVLPSIINMTSGAIQPPPRRTYLLNWVSCVCAPSLPVGRIILTK